MVNTQQYPHILQYQDLVSKNWIDLTICKDQPNNSGAKTTLADRTDYIFTSLVFVPKQSIIIKPGQNLRILTDTREVRLIGTAARFSKDDFSYRIWI